MKLQLSLSLLFLSLSGLGHCAPVVVYDTLAGFRGTGFSVASPTSAHGPGAVRRAFAFTTGASTSNWIGVDAALYPYVSGGAGSASGSATDLTLSIFTNALGSPSTWMGDLTFTPPPLLTDVSGAGSFVSASPIALASNTTYWVVAAASGTAYYAWAQNVVGALNHQSSLNSGPWSSSAGTVAARVTLDTVPELNPAGAVLPFLFLSGVLAVGLGKRRALSL
jgi:hypothetical protein